MAILVLAALALAAGWAVTAQGERSQKGDLIVFLDGGLSPLALPRDRPAPVSVHLEGGLQTANRQPLPRVTRIEIGLPVEGVISTKGLPVCRAASLRSAKPPEALAACRDALVGRGKLRAQVSLPNQGPFAVEARVLAFNGRVAGRRAVLLHTFASNPPSVSVLPLRLGKGSGRFGLSLTGNLPAALGPWPRLSRFDLTLFRRYAYRGRSRSYISASCPIPRRNTAGFFSLAKVTFGLEDGGQIGTGIARSCRGR